MKIILSLFILCVAITIVSVIVYGKYKNAKTNLIENLNEDGKSIVINFRNLLLLFIFLLGACISTIAVGTVYANKLDRQANIEQLDSLDSKTMEQCLNRMETLDKEALLIEAIGYVESRNNPSCPGGGEMQITKVCVDAANRLQDKVKYSYDDRYSREKSVEIWNIIQSNCNKKGDIEHGIRLWNGGPGYTKAGTQDYYEKVITRYNYLIDKELEHICRQYKSLSFK